MKSVNGIDSHKEPPKEPPKNHQHAQGVPNRNGSVDTSPNWIWLRDLCGYGIIVPRAENANMVDAVMFLDGIKATDEQKQLFAANWTHFWKSKSRKKPYPRDITSDWDNVLGCRKSGGLLDELREYEAAQRANGSEA
jgi:hypothetical protein